MACLEHYCKACHYIWYTNDKPDRCPNCDERGAIFTTFDEEMARAPEYEAEETVDYPDDHQNQ